MFLPARYTCNDKRAVQMFRAQFGVSPLAAGWNSSIVQIADINKGTFIQTYQSTMSLIVTFLEGRDNEIVVKELAVADSHINRVSSYVFKRP